MSGSEATMPHQGRLAETSVARRVHNLLWVSDWTPVGCILALYFMLTGLSWLLRPGTFASARSYEFFTALTPAGLDAQLVWGTIVFLISAGSFLTLASLRVRLRMVFLTLMAILILFLAGSFYVGNPNSVALIVYPMLGAAEAWQIIRTYVDVAVTPNKEN